MENRNKRFAWNDNSVAILLDIWAVNIDNLRAAKRNSHIYRNMKNKMLERKIICDISDIANKIKNLSQKYRAEKKLQDSSGISSDWRWFESIDRIMTGLHLTSFSLKEENTNNIETRYFPGKIIKCEMNFHDNQRCESNQSVAQLSPSYVSVSPELKKTKLTHIYREMLDEMRKINKTEEERSKREEKHYELSAEFMKNSLKKQEQANKIAEQAITLAKENLEIQKLILKSILKNK